MIQLPIIGAFLEATGMMLEKKVLKNKGIDFKNYTTFGFLAIVLASIPIIAFTWSVKREAFAPLNLFLLFLVVIVSALANLLIFYSLKRQNITEFEPLWLMQPLFTILLAFIFFKSERNVYLLIPALVASATLVLTHVKKHHLAFDKYVVAVIAGSFLFAVELILSKGILQYYDAFTFYFIRCFLIFFVCYIVYKPKTKGFTKKITSQILIVSIIWIFYRAIVYWGYQALGVIFTTTLFILSPVLMFVFAMIFLKEKPKISQIVSTIVIVLCVAVSVYFNS